MPLLLNNAPMPAGDPVVYPKDHPQAGMVTRPWLDWFNNLLSNQEKTSGRIATVTLNSQSAAITPSDIETVQPLTAGLYALKYYLRLQVVDSISADVQVIFRWTWNGDARQYDGTSISANLLSQTGTDYILLRIDNNTTITYETNVSFGGGDARYAIDIVLDEVQA